VWGRRRVNEHTKHVRRLTLCNRFVFMPSYARTPSLRMMQLWCDVSHDHGPTTEFHPAGVLAVFTRRPRARRYTIKAYVRGFLRQQVALYQREFVTSGEHLCGMHLHEQWVRMEKWTGTQNFCAKKRGAMLWSRCKWMFANLDGCACNICLSPRVEGGTTDSFGWRSKLKYMRSDVNAQTRK